MHLIHTATQGNSIPNTLALKPITTAKQNITLHTKFSIHLMMTANLQIPMPHYC